MNDGIKPDLRLPSTRGTADDVTAMLLERVSQAEQRAQRALDAIDRDRNTWPNGLATELDRIKADVAAKTLPGPYAELVGRLKALEDDAAILKRMQDSLATIVDSQTTPLLTVRMWREGERWRYETTVTLKPDTIEAMPNTLAWVDEMARAEVARREGQDALGSKRNG